MHRDELCEFHVDIEGLERLCSGRHCAIKGSRTVCADGAHSAGRFGDGAPVVALSPAEGWGGLGEIVGRFRALGAVALGIKVARAWVNAGARYICSWGPDSEQVHESFDYADFLPEFGQEVDLMTNGLTQAGSLIGPMLMYRFKFGRFH